MRRKKRRMRRKDRRVRRRRIEENRSRKTVTWLDLVMTTKRKFAR